MCLCMLDTQGDTHRPVVTWLMLSQQVQMAVALGLGCRRSGSPFQHFI